MPAWTPSAGPGGLTLSAWLWIDQAVGFVAAHPGAALALAFVAAVVEALAVIGMIVPGTPVMMAAAGAAAAAGQPMAPFVIVAVAGAVIGDFISFWVGRRYAGLAPRIWPFVRRPELLRRGEGFFRRYGAPGVALCRFVPVLRSTVPLVAGMAHMPPRQFVLANVASALVWAPAHIYPAQLAGLSLQRLEAGKVRAFLICAVALLLIGGIAYGVQRVLAGRARP